MHTQAQTVRSIFETEMRAYVLYTCYRRVIYTRVVFFVCVIHMHKRGAYQNRLKIKFIEWRAARVARYTQWHITWCGGVQHMVAHNSSQMLISFREIP